MTDQQKLSQFVLLTGETDEELARSYLDVASGMVVQRAYPFVADRSVLALPEQYDSLHLQLAVTLWARRGAEGETLHDENGIKRRYVDLESILGQVVPYVGISYPEPFVER